MNKIIDIYKGISDRFYKNTNIDIKRNTVVDNIFLASAEGINELYVEIEKNKNPYFMTNLEGSDLDSIGVLKRCARRPNEKDEEYYYRLINWNSINESSNRRAIESCFTALKYASTANYVPYTEGVGTASIYIIPKKYDEDTMAKAVEEVKNRVQKVTSPGSYIKYIIPKIVPVKVVAYFCSKEGDEKLIKKNIEEKIKKYINSIPTKSNLEVGQINKIGVNEPGTNFFNVMQLYINGESTTNISILQKQGIKFIFENIIWWEVMM